MTETKSAPHVWDDVTRIKRRAGMYGVQRSAHCVNDNSYQLSYALGNDAHASSPVNVHVFFDLCLGSSHQSRGAGAVGFARRALVELFHKHEKMF